MNVGHSIPNGSSILKGVVCGIDLKLPRDRPKNPTHLTDYQLTALSGSVGLWLRFTNAHLVK